MYGQYILFFNSFNQSHFVKRWSSFGDSGYPSNESMMKTASCATLAATQTVHLMIYEHIYSRGECTVGSVYNLKLHHIFSRYMRSC